MMIQIENTIISMDLFDKHFCCDLSVCKGVCCIEGDAGAPLDDEEIPILERILPIIWDDLSEDSKEVIGQQGVFYIDEEGDKVTPIVKGGKCVFTYFEKDGFCKCAIEKAYREGKIDFYKPISCHLYPVRLENFRNGDIGVNIHRWKICECAFKLGKRESLPMYKFLKDPLIRRFGREWYDEVCIAAEELKKIKG